MTIALHVVLNNFKFDSRVLKETYSLVAGPCDKVHIAALWEDGVSQKEVLDDKRDVWRIRLASRGLPKNLFFQTLKYLEWIAKIYRGFRKEKVSVVHCHDLSALPVGILFKLTRNTRVIYDAHELESEQETGYPKKPSLRKRVFWMVERRLIPMADAMITVSPSILRWYADRFPRTPISLIRNIPSLSANGHTAYPLRAKLKIPDDALLFLLIGMLDAGRGIQIALDAFRDPLVRHHLAFMGNGPYRERIIDSVKKCPRIHLLDAVPHDQVAHYSRGADVGLCLSEDISLSIRFCLPNKLFESLLGGIPVLASDLPDQAHIVETYRAGWVVQNNPNRLIQVLKQLTVKEAKTMRSGLTERVKELSWDNEAKTLLDVYAGILAHHTGNPIDSPNA